MVIAVGLDAADPDLLDAYVADGTMPALASLRAAGVSGVLDGVDRYRAETPWTTFLTGCSAQTTGYWGPIRFNPRTYLADEWGAYLFDRYPPFYVLTGERPACVFDVPQTRLRGDLDGIQVLGWGSHSQQGPACSSPPGLLDELCRLHGVSPVDDETATSAYDVTALDAFNDTVLQALERRAKLSRDLLQRGPWGLYLTVVAETHSGGHELWHHGRPHPLQRPGVDRIRPIYAAADRVIGALLSAAPADARVIVFSLHGMSANHLDVPSMAILPEVMARWALGETLVSGAAHAAGAADTRHWKYRVWDQRTTAGDRCLHGPRHLAGQGDVLDWQPAQWYRPLWPRMRAFALPSYSDGAIRFNLQGRETGGLVAPGEAAALAAEITAVLRQLVDAESGRPVVDEVVRLERGTHEGAPADLLVVWSDAAVAAHFRHPELGEFGPYPWFRTGGHRSLGCWTACGPGIEPLQPVPRGTLMDLTATILHLAGVAPPPWMEGASLLRCC